MTTDDDIRRSALRRFLPACVAGFAAVFLLDGFPPLAFPQIALITIDVLGLTLGYGSVLKLGRRFIRDSQKITGFRAVLAGAIAPVTAGIAMAFFQGFSGSLPILLAASAGLTVMTGGYLGAAMFLRRRVKPKQAPLELDSGESIEDWFKRTEREAEREFSPWSRLKSAVTGMVSTSTAAPGRWWPATR